MSEKQCKKAMFLIIERPLDPPPPLESTPQWYYSNTLGFYNKNNKCVWEQKIPEAGMLYKPLYHHDNGKWEYWRDEFGSYFHCEVFKDKHFGWQLRLKISHHYAEIWYNEIMAYIRKYHENHFKNKKSGDP
jgi:hypothetical protein